MDRIIQQAMVQILTPIFEEQFHDNSYGFRQGRSCEQAVLKVLEYLSAGVMVNGIKMKTKVGTPQGGNLSPLLSNIMLNELDKELDARGLNFVRYADDCIILVKSEKAANRVLTSITKFIEKKLGLKVNAEKSKVTRPTKTKYLSFSFWRTAGGKWKPKPHIKSYQKLIRKLKQLTKRSWSISLDERIKKINYLVRGWVNYFRIANMKSRITEIDKHLRTRIRAIIWKQWKVPTKKEKALKQLGVKPDIAHNLANTRKGYQLVSKTDWMKFAINIERLRKRGLVFLLDQYTKVHIECTNWTAVCRTACTVVWENTKWNNYLVPTRLNSYVWWWMVIVFVKWKMDHFIWKENNS